MASIAASPPQPSPITSSQRMAQQTQLILVFITIQAPHPSITTVSGAMAHNQQLGVLGTLSQKYGFAFGANLQNMGGKLGGSNLPRNLKLGIAKKDWVEDKLTTALDLDLPFGNNPKLHIGAEYKHGNKIFFRVGYECNKGREKIGGVTGVSAGMGWAKTFGSNTVQLDYVWVPFGDLGDTHRVSLMYKIGTISPTPNQPPTIKLIPC